MQKKVIRVTLTLQGKDEVFTAKDNRLQSTELAVSAVITHGNGAITPTAQITISNLGLDVMLKLMRIQWNTMQSVLNTVKVEVGDQGEELKVAYEGNITFATINTDSAPDVSLIITSQMAIVDKLRATPPFTIPKDQVFNVADIVKFLATDSGYEFFNYGVDKQITDTKLSGSNIEKIEKLSYDHDFDLYIEQKTITICKKGGERQLKIPIITPNTGLIGYPAPDMRGIVFRCAYDPAVKFGGVVRIADSILGETVNQDWRVYGLIATLEANIPQGKWEMSVNATWRDSKYAAVQR